MNQNDNHGDNDTFDALHSFADIARELAGQPGMVDTTQRIVDLAVKVLGCDAAVLAHLHGGRVILEAGSNTVLTAAKRTLAHHSARTVSTLACQHRTTVLCNDLGTDPRWADVGPATVAASGVRAVVAFHLQLEDRDLGALTFYSQTAGYFTSRLCDLGGVYADHAAIALSMAREHDQVLHLTAALASNRVIGAAVGIVMTRFSIDNAAAFDMLRIASQRTNQKLHNLAQAIVTTGDITPIAAAAIQHKRTPTTA